MKRINRREQWWLKVVTTFLLVILLISFIDWQESLNLLMKADWSIGIWCVLTLLINIKISVLKWKFLLKAQALDITFGKLIRYYWIGIFFNNFLPSTVGGDAVRVALLQWTRRTAQVVSSIIVERATGLIIVVAWGGVSLLIWSKYFTKEFLIFSSWEAVGALILFGFLILIALKVFIRKLQIKKELDGKIQLILSKVSKILDAIRLYRKEKLIIAVSLLLSILFYLLMVIFQYLCFVMLDISITINDVLIIASLIILASMVPITINGIGITESVFILLYVQAGISAEEAFAAALLRRMLNLIISLVGGIFWLANSQEQSKSTNVNQFKV
ncbi:lysylphosphatidylglycerol synthase transmembrane domain-containing protein [Nitrosococcus wardiae]|uniref:lysylphosphatidylglycerol synthase transmembrane domain-containing protein n=1 Tax=Nitrosococcus wardiae TaxID=1814290 RepID=UPI00141A6A87|nr:lysylphosphatidylglycerol synthase transmembrane domain-containing protein [Nitrosococcus wardiae]